LFPCCPHYYWSPIPEDIHIDDNGDILVVGTMIEIVYQVLPDPTAAPACNPLPEPDMIPAPINHYSYGIFLIKITNDP